MEIVKQELASLEYIRSENYPIDHITLIPKQNHKSGGDGGYQDVVFSSFEGACFPFWQNMYFYAGGYDQWQGYQHQNMISPPIQIVNKAMAYNDPVFPTEPVNFNQPSDLSLAEGSSPFIRSQSSPQKSQQRRRRYNQFFWTLEENRRYLKFIKKNSGLLQLPTIQKKCLKVNVLMSFTVKSRNGQQCHSHHQKLMKKYGSIEGILANFEKDLAEERNKYRRSSKKKALGQIDQIKIEKSTIEDRVKQIDSM